VTLRRWLRVRAAAVGAPDPSTEPFVVSPASWSTIDPTSRRSREGDGRASARDESRAQREWGSFWSRRAPPEPPRAGRSGRAPEAGWRGASCLAVAWRVAAVRAAGWLGL